MASYETTGQIIEALRSAGHEISTQQLLDWNRRGLIPPAQQVGLGRRKGTETRFPIGTCRQVYALVSLQQSTGRDLNHVGWLLWIYGFKVADEYWKNPFIEASSELFEIIKLAIDKESRKDEGEIAISEDAIIALEAVSTSRNKSEMFGPVRRRLGKNNYVTFLRVILEVGVGIFDPSSKSNNHDPNLEEDLFGIFRKVIEDLDNSKFTNNILAELPVSAKELEEILGQLSLEFSKVRDGQIIEAFTEGDLRTGRYETNSIIIFFNTTIRPLNPKPRALELLQRLLDSLTAKQHASMIFIWLIARRVPSVSAGLQNIMQVANPQQDTQ